MNEHDTLANVLYVDLSKKSYRVARHADLFKKYLGGTGVATQLLMEECPPGIDPLSPENPIVFAVGPLTGLFPLASKAVAMFKSPHTGNLGESHCGGRTATAIRMAGYGAIVIRGASTLPVYISISGRRVEFHDASSIWGMHNAVTVGRILRENETGAGLRTNLRIGGAGEKLVSYACVSTEMYRHFGRLGLGAVFGSKKLKAIIISGRGSIPVVDARLYKEIYDDIYKKAVDSPVMKKYHDLGTAENVNPLNKLGGLPTRNLKEARFEHAEQVSGENYAQNYLGRRLSCSHCPISCIHVAALREPYVNDPYFYKTSMIGYDYEPIFSLGTMLGISSPEGLLKLMEEVEEYTVDAMSVGVVLAWATEAQERDIISYKDTHGLKFAWGDYETYIKAIRLISLDQPTDFYKALAKGVEYVATKYGGLDFAMSFGKNEMAGYHTGPGAYIGFLIGTRHSHLDNAGYSLDQKMQADNIMSPDKLVDALIKEECWRQVLSDLVICFFARGVYQADTVLKALTLAGFNLTLKDLERIGEEVFIEKYKFKFREGFTFDNMRLPSRMFETPAPVKFDENYMRQALEYAKKTITGKVNKV